MDGIDFLKLYDDFRGWFWNETFWLPANRTWADLKRNNTPGSPFYPDFYDLWFPLPMAVGLFFVRLMWERFIAQPIGRHYKLREMPPTRPVYNAVLEAAFKRHGKLLPNHSELVGLSKQIDWTTRQVERWWRRRRVQGKPSEMQRFKATSWRFLVYISVFWGGLYVIWDKPWLWDTKHCWYGYPIQHVSSDVWWYYMLEFSFYWSLVISLFTDVKQKDFWQVALHHVVTISLLVLSWTANTVRAGTLVLCVHDAVDYFVEGAKLANYCNFPKLRDCLFVCFVVVWVLTRMTLYPLWILHSSLFESHAIAEMTNIIYACNILLCVLQVMHCIWFYMILRVVYAYVFKGKLEKDIRSDTEVETNSEDESVVQSENNAVNGVGRSNNNQTTAGKAETKNRSGK